MGELEKLRNWVRRHLGHENVPLSIGKRHTLHSRDIRK